MGIIVLVLATLIASAQGEGKTTSECVVCATRAQLERSVRCATCRDQAKPCGKCEPILELFGALKLPCPPCNKKRALAMCEDCQKKGDVCTICDVEDRVHFCLSCARTSAAERTLHCDKCTAAERCAACAAKLARLTKTPCAECAYRRRVEARAATASPAHAKDQCLFATLRAFAADEAHCSRCRIDGRTCKECEPLVTRIEAARCATCER